MSSRHSRYPTRWSEWEWNATYQRYARYREVLKGKWEWEYAEPPPTETREPYANAASHETLDRIDEQAQHYDDPQASQHHVIDSDEVSGLAQEVDQVYIDPNQKGGNYPKERQHSGSQQYSKDQPGHDEQRRAKHHRSDNRRGRGTKGKGKDGDTSYEKRSHTSEGHAPEPYPVGSGEDYRPEYGGAGQNTTPGGFFEYPPSQLETSQGYDSERPTSQQSGTQGYNEQDQQYAPQSGNYPAPGYGVAPAYEPQTPRYVPPPPTQSNITRRNVYTKDPSRTKDKLDSRFQVHRSKEFYFGRVFKVLWSEPIGSGGTEITQQSAKYGESAFHKVRRFVIIRKDKGHSICIPILTYGYQGVLKNGVHPEDHTVVYSSKDGPFFLPGERKLLTKRPIRLDMFHPSEKLDPHSRLNYAKIYTVEHNVKVFFIGWVARNYEQEVATAFNETNPPIAPALSDRQSGRPEEPLFNHAEGNSGSNQQHPSTYHTTDMYSLAPQADPTYAISYNATPQMPQPGYQEPSSQGEYNQSAPTYEDGYEA